MLIKRPVPCHPLVTPLSPFEELQHSYFSIKKVKLQSAIKKGDDIVVVYKIWPEQNDANVTQTDVVFHFLNGVSESKNVNELFSTMSHYVPARE